MARMSRNRRKDTPDDGLVEKVIHINRVAKVVKGGRIFGFTALTVVGDGNGKVGFGRGKAREVPVAIQKAMEAARRNMIQVELNNGTIQYTEFLSAAADRKRLLQEDKVWEAFNQFDRNGDGKIQQKELREWMHRLGFRAVEMEDVEEVAAEVVHLQHHHYLSQVNLLHSTKIHLVLFLFLHP